MTPLRARILTIGAAAVAVLPAAGCGAEDKAKDAASGAKAALDPVAQAADVTAQQKGGMAIALNGVVDAGGVRAPLSGTGTVDRAGRRGPLTLITEGGGQKVRVEEVFAGHVYYVRSPVFAGKLPGGKSWMKVDLDKAAKQQGIDLSALGGSAGPSQDPAQMLDYLRGAGKSSKLGQEDVRGVKTTRYQVLVDPRKAIARARTPEAKDALTKAFSHLRSKTIPVDVYVDDKHLVRREHLGLALQQDGKSVSMELTIDFTGFDVPVKADPPADEDTVDALELLKSQGGGTTNG